MRLANGIIIDKEKTFGVLKFSALRREVHIQNEDGTVSEEIKERTYDLKCKEQGRMIQVLSLIHISACARGSSWFCFSDTGILQATLHDFQRKPLFWNATASSRQSR